MKRIYLIILLCGVIIINNSCNKIFGVNGTYTIRGRFLKDCNGEPIANYAIRLEQNGGLFSKSRDLAKDTTDANGYYEFTNIPINNRENLEVLHDIKWDQVTNWGGYRSILYVKAGDVITWNFYIKITYNTVMKIKIDQNNFVSNDTLYVGQTKANFNFFYPIPSETIVKFSSEIGLGIASDTTSGATFWGRNKKDFDSACNSQLKYHTFFSKYALCIYPDTNYITIP